MTVRAIVAVAAVAGVVTLLGACAPSVREPTPGDGAALPPDFPAAAYRDAIRRGERVYRIDTAGSLVVIEVRREGSLAHLGHDHMVASRDLEGYVLPDEGRADLAIPLARLTVDEPDLRAEAGLDTQPSSADVDATRRNMLTRVLAIDRHPFATIRVARSEPRSDRIEVAITLHGATRRFEVPVRIEAEGDGIVASGRLSFDQSAFGIVPYSILGGAIAVRDRVDLRYRIRAVAVAHPG